MSESTSQKPIESLQDYLKQIDEHVKNSWTAKQLLSLTSLKSKKTFLNTEDIPEKLNRKWFRGQPVDCPLLPRVFRKKYNEKEMALNYCNEAASLPGVPPSYDFGSWTSLMQHHGLSTRLLDWTESAAVALFFAVENWREYKDQNLQEKYNPIVWLINPHAFNWVSIESSIIPNLSEGQRVESINEKTGKKEVTDFIKKYVAPIYGDEDFENEEAVAVKPKYVHPRMLAQSSRFTIHGRNQESLENYFFKTELFEKEFVKKFSIAKEKSKDIFMELQALGIKRSILFPGLEGIAKEIEERFVLD